ncbi:MAG: hypothetical protein MUD01_10135 [Chloroflexaceae bacterium]|jgi:hypothetical protein|nr:hypothetical protein [Chloroflexaceae bacterium]
MVPYLLLAGLLALGMQAMRLHLGRVNAGGSPRADVPFVIDAPTLAQAIYGRLDEQHAADYYRFTGMAGVGVRLLLLIPTSAYERGLRAQFHLYGPALPPDGATATMKPHELTIAGRGYMLVQTYVPPLEADGDYAVRVSRVDGAGAYCLCIGDREGGHADAATRERINQLLEV